MAPAWDLIIKLSHSSVSSTISDVHYGFEDCRLPKGSDVSSLQETVECFPHWGNWEIPAFRCTLSLAHCLEVLDLNIDADETDFPSVDILSSGVCMYKGSHALLPTSLISITCFISPFHDPPHNDRDAAFMFGVFKLVFLGYRYSWYSLKSLWWWKPVHCQIVTNALVVTWDFNSQVLFVLVWNEEGSRTFSLRCFSVYSC